MKRKLLLTMLLSVGFVLVQAQTDSYLYEISKNIKELRKDNNSVRNSAISRLSAASKPKLTLMDEIKWAGSEEEKTNEVKGVKGNRFKLNQVITYVYKKQNQLLESKGDMLNGNELDIHYSVIEKSVKRGSKVTYMIKGREGMQTFFIIPHNPNSKYEVYMQGKCYKANEDGDCHIPSFMVSRGQVITFSICYLDDKANKDLIESFAILNYNPQK